MREIVVISGKGGTGKTSLTAAFAHLSENKVLCDLDVDAPDLHILLAPEPLHREEFYSGNQAIIDPARCIGCGTCQELCAFEAISSDGEVYAIDPLRCEGCKVCVTLCPEQAIDFPPRHCGSWSVSTTRFGPMVHAQLFPGQENSGRLVMLLKQEARRRAEEQGLDLILCDGAPGIGCPVISSLSGTTLAVLVTEPTPSGRHDLERVAELCNHFRVQVVVILNKFELNSDEAARIEAYCSSKGYPLIAKLPHDNIVTRAMVQRRAVTELPDCTFTEEIKRAWERIEERSRIGKQENSTGSK
ncbi:MAG: 4Fe-4S binding protein [Proteobacteria bacterium]|nr:4Fe-4S binding protein [Pseudomonadota bacterium]